LQLRQSAICGASCDMFTTTDLPVLVEGLQFAVLPRENQGKKPRVKLKFQRFCWARMNKFGVLPRTPYGPYSLANNAMATRSRVHFAQPDHTWYGVLRRAIELAGLHRKDSRGPHAKQMQEIEANEPFLTKVLCRELSLGKLIVLYSHFTLANSGHSFPRTITGVGHPYLSTPSWSTKV
jgi:hypothetical protein